MSLRQLQALLGIVVVVLLLGVTLSACGSDDGESDSVRTGADNGSAKSDNQNGKPTAQGSKDGQKPDGVKNDDGSDDKGKADSTPDDKSGEDTPQRTSSPKKKQKKQDTETAEPPSTEPAPAAGDAPCPSALSQQACNELLEGFSGKGALARGECPKALTDEQCRELKAALEKVPR